MKAIRAVVGVVLTAVSAAGGLAGQVPPTPEQVARFRAAAEPGPEHATLARLAGEWDQTILVWPGPGTDPLEVRGESTNRLLLGGRFLEIAAAADWPGRPVEAATVVGFDRRRGEYTVIRMDSQGTYWVTASGLASSGGRIVMSGTDEDPILGHTQIYDIVLTIDGADRYVLEFIFHDEMHTRGGGPFRALQIVSTRKER